MIKQGDTVSLNVDIIKRTTTDEKFKKWAEKNHDRLFLVSKVVNNSMIVLQGVQYIFGDKELIKI